METKISSCPCCLSCEIELKYITHDRHYGFINDKFNVYECKICNLIFINPMIEQNELNNMYNNIKNYYAYNQVTPKRRKHFKKLFNRIGNILLGTKSSFPDLNKFNNKNLLDLGCGSGTFLQQCKIKGINPFGVELSKEAADYGLSQGINIFSGTLINANFPNEKFDVIRSNHSFEHLLDPKETLTEMNRILKTQGVLFIGVPNTRSIPFNLFKKYWYYLGVPFHPYNYSVKSLSILLDQYGFEVLKVEYNGNWQGTLGSFQIYLNRKNNRTSLDGKFINIVTKVFFEQIARLFNLFSQGDCIEVTAIKK